VDGQVLWSGLERELEEKLLSKALSQISEAKTGMGAVELDNGISVTYFLQLFNPPPRLIILGGGHVGAALSRMAALLDYEIIVIDDRPSFVSREKHPGAHQLICSDFERALDSLPATLSDYMVIVTRGHRHDRLCLEKALGRPAAYFGMIGSRKRVRELLEELAVSGFSQENLARAHTPIGLDIGAVTEGEIALSILAEITAVRRGGGGQEPVQSAVLQELVSLEQPGNCAVLATIIRAYGSTPRKAGTTMLVYPDGQITGTVGGGCAEAEVRREALQMMQTSAPRIYTLDLTADAAAEEGMACGGRMKIFLEPLSCPEASPS
jgi:xanthine dehydrogenase accessory factor